MIGKKQIKGVGMKKTQIFNYILVISLFILTTWILIKSERTYNISDLILKTNKWYLLVSFLFMFFFWLTDAIIIKYIFHTFKVKFDLIKSLKVILISQYYSAITPFASGGQPAQIYSMVQSGIPFGQASFITILKFIIHQIVVTFFALLMFLWKFNLVFREVKLMLYLVLIGLSLNLIVIIFMYGLFFNYKLLENITNLIFKLITKIKFLTKLKKHKANIILHLQEYRENAEYIKEHKKLSLNIGLMTIIQLTFYYSIPYLIYLALGYTKFSYLDILALEALLAMTISFMPTPGAAGVAEGAFYILFQAIFQQKVLYAILLWRVITYYFAIIVSGIFTLIDHLKFGKLSFKYNVKND